MKGFHRYILIFGVSLIAQFAIAQALFDARNAGMAYSNAADLQGLQQVGGNPAMLALPHWAGLELNLLSGSASVSNNSFSKGLYDRYFTTGDTLSLSDKSNILNAIPNGGVQGSLSAGLNAFSLYMPNFSIALTGIGNGYVNLPREAAELALNGNDDPGRRYDLSTVDGEAWGGVATMVGLAIPLKLNINGLESFAIGVAGKYITGLAYYEVQDAEGVFQNWGPDHNYLDLNGQLVTRSARGGNGYGFDLGFMARTSQKWTLGLNLANIMGKVDWKEETELTYLSIKADSFAVGFEEFDEIDELFSTEDSTQEISGFSTRLPAMFELSAAYQASENWLLSAQYEKGFNQSMGATTEQRFAIGTEFQMISFLPLRSGISLGGGKGVSFAFGGGLNLKYWYLDVGVINHGGFSGGDARGLTLAVTSRFRM